MKKLLITKGNALIRARFYLTIAEQRLILICISKIKPDEVITTDTLFEVSAAELAKLSGATRTSAYQDLKSVVERLYERSIYIGENGKARWVTFIDFGDDKSSAQLTFSQQVIPFISELKGKFTSYELKNVANFRSAHAFRIYEMLAQFPDLNEQKFNINRLRDMMMLDGKYTKSADFKKRVIDPAIKDINELSNINVTVEPIKNKREVVAFVFRYKVEKRQIMTINGSDPDAYPGESMEDYLARKRNKKNK